MGNYDAGLRGNKLRAVIPLREEMGNYDNYMPAVNTEEVIPQRKKMGNNGFCPNVQE